MKRKPLTVTSQIVRCVLSAMVPMSLVAAYFVWTGIKKDIDTARLEQAGDAYQLPLERVLEGVEGHQKATGAGADLERARQSGEKIEAGLAGLQKVQSQLGEELQVTAEGLKSRKRESYAPAHIEQEWKAMQREWPDLGAGKRAERYEALEADVRGLIAHIGDTSGLILDPDLDSYYLMDATLVALPQTQTRLRQMRGFYRGLNMSKPLDQASHSAAAVLAAQLKSDDMDRITGDFDTCLKEDGNFNGISPTLKPNLTQASGRYVSGNNALLTQMAEFDKTPSLAKQAALESALDEAIASSYTLETTAIGELDRLLEYRVSGRYAALGQGIAGMMTALALSGLYTFVSLRRLRRNLAEHQAELSRSSENLLSTGNESAERAKELARAAEDQATALERTATASQEISAISQTTAKQSSEASGLMQQVGGNVEDLRARAKELSRSMTEMQKASGEISGIVSVISKIAFQTNLLALNAAVEAARAGEMGLGFSVVADEVRKLAQSSAAEANHISELVDASIAKTKAGEQDLEAVLAGIESVARQSLRASTAIESISSAEAEQARGIKQIAQSILQMQKVTEGTAANAEAGVKTSEDLWQNAENLQQVVQELTLLTGAGV